jgi:hypothetical protein
MTEQERKVVNHAMKILEQSQDDEARALAVKLLEQGTKVPLQKVQFYAAYCNGLRDGYSRIFDLIQGGGWLAKVSKKEMPYFEAEKELVESCIDAFYDYHMGKYDIRYKNKELSKSGNGLQGCFCETNDDWF